MQGIAFGSSPYRFPWFGATTKERLTQRLLHQHFCRFLVCSVADKQAAHVDPSIQSIEMPKFIVTSRDSAWEALLKPVPTLPPQPARKPLSNDNAETAAQPLDSCKAPCLEGLNLPSTPQGVKGTFRPGKEFAQNISEKVYRKPQQTLQHILECRLFHSFFGLKLPARVHGGRRSFALQACCKIHEQNQRSRGLRGQHVGDSAPSTLSHPKRRESLRVYSILYIPLHSKLET